jgi:hypothetical protein
MAPRESRRNQQGAAQNNDFLGWGQYD